MFSRLRSGGSAFLLALLLVACIARQSAGETVLHDFVPPSKGAMPVAGVIRDSAGNLYGTTSSGGSADLGVVYKVDKNGDASVLYNFLGGSKGSNPSGGVIRDSAGNFYGTTYWGGAANAGVVYKLDATGHETVLYSFTGGADGSQPYSGVVRDSEGNLYGTTPSGGSAGSGVVYKVDPTGHETVLYAFTGGADGGIPYAGVIRDKAGNLYGTTNQGGSSEQGVVYKLDPTGHETVLYRFTGFADGGGPFGGVILDSAGNLYGTTRGGGSIGAGVVYKVDSANHETVLYDFTGGGDGGEPYAGVIRDAVGNLYGTTFSGGSSGVGVAYKVDAAGHETVLHSFCSLKQCADGIWAYGGIIRDSAGHLYGATNIGGLANLGVVFKLDATGHETVLYSFTDNDGIQPYSGAIRDAAGNLYGTTFGGGSSGVGVVYKVEASGHETVLYNFRRIDGAYPYAGVIRDSAGNLYGTTSAGGDFPACGGGGCGVVYKLDTGGHDHVLYAFTGGSDGGNPYAGVVRDSTGNLYGTTYTGGNLSACGGAGCGVVYKVDPSGHETVLYSFTGGADGGQPYTGLIRDLAGNLYGTTRAGGSVGAGAVYKLDASGHETVLYSFTGEADGGGPEAGVIRDSAGNLYGTTSGGGSAGYGVVYKIDTSEQESVLYSFSGQADGGNPYASVVRDPAGNLYGTTYAGGSAGHGVVYKIDTSGQERVLHSFTGRADGYYVMVGVIRDAAGNLYGTTRLGGTKVSGVVFRIP